MSDRFDTGFRYGWLHGHGAAEMERERLAVLNKPFPGNPPELLKLTRCKVLRAFGLAGGKVAEVGATIELQRHDALSLAACKKVELLP